MLNTFEEDGTLIKGFLIEDFHQVCWGRKELLEKPVPFHPFEISFCHPPTSPYFTDIMKERFGFGSLILSLETLNPWRRSRRTQKQNH